MYVNKGEEHISSTKTKSGTRRIIINKKLIETLERWKKEQTGRLREFPTDTEKLQIFQDSPNTLTKNSIEKQYKKILAMYWPQKVRQLIYPKDLVLYCTGLSPFSFILIRLLL